MFPGDTAATLVQKTPSPDLTVSIAEVLRIAENAVPTQVDPGTPERVVQTVSQF